jgi:hypothetical protein
MTNSDIRNPANPPKRESETLSVYELPTGDTQCETNSDLLLARCRLDKQQATQVGADDEHQQPDQAREAEERTAHLDPHFGIEAKIFVDDEPRGLLVWRGPLGELGGQHVQLNLGPRDVKTGSQAAEEKEEPGMCRRIPGGSHQGRKEELGSLRGNPEVRGGVEDGPPEVLGRDPDHHEGVSVQVYDRPHDLAPPAEGALP